MTKYGKCETCRRRKVKCDEAWPSCGACSKKRRECHYSNVTDSVFVYEQTETSTLNILKQETAASEVRTTDREEFNTAKGAILRVKQLQKAQSGHGEFLTFEQTTVKQFSDCSSIRSSSSPSKQSSSSISLVPAMLCPQSTLATKWGSIFGYEALDLNPLGAWVKSAWVDSGEDAYLDLASKYALESMQTFKSRDQTSLIRTCRIGERALQSLQLALDSYNDGSNKQSLVIAVMLHCAAEQFLELGTKNYVHHVRGFCKLIESFYANHPCDNVVHNAISLTCVDEVITSILMGKSSSFEDLKPQFGSLDAPCDLTTALEAVDYLLFQAPRLICLLRSAITENSMENKIAVADPVNRLFRSDMDLYAGKTLEMHMDTISDPSRIMQSPMGSALHFDILPAFVLATRYYLWRVFICGLLQTLTSLDQDFLYFTEADVFAAQQDDIEAATGIAMCLDYAFKCGPTSPITALGVLIPLIVSFGTWKRLHQRQPYAGRIEHEQAERMKHWIVEKVTYLERMWRDKPSTFRSLERVAGLFEGGPLVGPVFHPTDSYKFY